MGERLIGRNSWKPLLDETKLYWYVKGMVSEKNKERWWEGTSEVKQTTTCLFRIRMKGFGHQIKRCKILCLGGERSQQGQGVGKSELLHVEHSWKSAPLTRAHILTTHTPGIPWSVILCTFNIDTAANYVKHQAACKCVPMDISLTL